MNLFAGRCQGGGSAPVIEPWMELEAARWQGIATGAFEWLSFQEFELLSPEAQAEYVRAARVHLK